VRAALIEELSMTLIERFPRFRSVQVRYVLPVCFVAVSIAAIFYSQHFLRAPYLVSFMGAVAVSALFGIIPGFIATALATLASDFFFIPPIMELNLDHFTLVAAANYGLAVLVARVSARVLGSKGRDQKIKLALFMILKELVNGQNRHKQNRRLLGRLDGDVDGEIYGWAYDANEPSEPPKLTVCVDSRPVGEVLPVWHRQDIGPHCFYFDLSQCCPPGPAYVETKFQDGLRLPNSPLRVEIPVASGAAASETILFLHIPKTAGTAFREAIVGNYKASQVAYLYPDPPGFLPCDFGSLPLEQRARFRLVIGHYHYGVHQFLPQKSIYCTIVRDPVKRVISHFRYLMEPQKALRAASPSLLAELLERGATVNLDNLMVRCFSGVVKADVPPGHVNRDVFELAVHNLRTSFKFVGYQEQSRQAYTALQAQFGWNRLAALEVVNRGAADDAGFESVRKTIEHFNRWDCQLHAEIRRLFPG
jgi:Domain of unknown function (DUF4118)/Sulfotransferase family